MDIQKMKDIVGERIGKKRYLHSMNVADTAVSLAQQYGADAQKACIAGVLHDITKELDEKEHMKLCQLYEIKLDDVEKSEPKLLHAITGAYVAKEEFLVDDDVFYAIRYHTTGRANMSLLEKIIYLADYIEPSRAFLGVDKLREKVFRDIDEGLAYALEMSIEEVRGKNKKVHYNTIEARDYLYNKSATCKIKNN